MKNRFTCDQCVQRASACSLAALKKPRSAGARKLAWMAVLSTLPMLASVVLPARAAMTEAWVQRYVGPPNSDDGGMAVAVDRNGGVVVTGYSDNGIDGKYDYYTAKYAAVDGVLLWEQRFNGPGSDWDVPEAVALDRSGNVIVAGLSRHGSDLDSSDFHTAKYATANGALLWEKRCDGPGNGYDRAHAVSLDDSGNVIVTGYSAGIGAFNYDYYTAKYAGANGALLWERRYDGPGRFTSDDAALAMALDRNGNAIVTGYSDSEGHFSDCYTAKYAAGDGSLLWEKRYDSPAHGYDVPNAIDVDREGNAVITGYSEGTRRDFYTAKYAAADGSLLWEKRYDGPLHGDDVGNAVAVDNVGNVVVTGYSRGPGLFADDFYTAKYAAEDGALLWEKRYNGPGNRDDRSVAIVVDSNGDVIVTGPSANSDGVHDYYTARYASTDGALLWEKRYNGPANGYEFMRDSRHCLALVPNGRVVITGASDGDPGFGINYDYATVVYRENFPPVITCPSNTVADATNVSGTVVNFAVIATDEGRAAPTVTCVPASGAMFPIGQTTVTCTAADSDGLSSECPFLVTVLGARGVEESVLGDLVILRVTVTNQDDARRLDEAIASLAHSLATEFWEDEMHLERRHGGTAFQEAKVAIQRLCELLLNHKSNLQASVDRLIRASRLLASVAIQEAASLPENKIEQALEFLARGDESTGTDRCANGVENYRNAWKLVARAKMSPPVRLASGHVGLEIAGEPGEALVIEVSSNLQYWVPLVACTADADGMAKFEDTDASQHATRFYRISVP